MKERALIAWVGLLLPFCLFSCRALTEPDLQSRPVTGRVRVEGRVFLPDGAPASGGELLLDNRIYEPNRDDWVQARIALDAEGRFDTLVRLGELTDVIFDPAGLGGPPSYRFLGMETARLPWVLHHPMREVAVTADLPDSLRIGLRNGDLFLRTRRPRPAGENAFHENYVLPIDSTATARGWLLPGNHEVELRLRHHSGSELTFEFPDSVDVAADAIPSLRPWLRGQYLDLVLPDGIPGTPEFEFYARRDLVGETTYGTIRSWTVFSAGQRRVWGTLPREIQFTEVSGTGVTLMTRPFIESTLTSIGPIHLADHWLELVVPAGGSTEEFRWVELHSGGDSSRQISLAEGGALFLLNRGAYYIEVRNSDDEFVGSRTYESVESRTLPLDF